MTTFDTWVIELMSADGRSRGLFWSVSKREFVPIQQATGFLSASDAMRRQRDDIEPRVADEVTHVRQISLAPDDDRQRQIAQAERHGERGEKLLATSQEMAESIARGLELDERNAGLAEQQVAALARIADALEALVAMQRGSVTTMTSADVKLTLKPDARKGRTDG